MAKISVSVVILNYNGKAFIEPCLDSVLTSGFSGYEVIFVDNHSRDGSAEFVERRYPGVRVIKNGSNTGFSAGNNNAVSFAQGEYLFFLNNDTRLHERALSVLCAAMEQDPSIGICGCTIMDYEGRKTFHAGIGVDIFGYPVAGGEVFYAEGSALLIRKSLFQRLGGFDESYFMFHEDVDLAWRARLLGYRVAVVPEAVVYHAAGASAGGTMDKGMYRSTLFRRYLSERNNIRTLFKDYGYFSLLFVFPLYFLINVSEIVFFLLVLQPKTAYCYLKAYGWNVLHFADTLRCRMKIQRERAVSDQEILNGMYKGSGKLLVVRKVRVPVFE
ncbi:MAG: glycosyltransferase family 2 protein [Candidatus Omnitrophica bacterium]|nr:glycosyltransferase family 2 protein [Candidatus Omnitrophota bacterium]